ncbi:EKC/KEOPS complex subunit Tprkb isoform X1 [Rhodamnia argentea]|uniref:EKC/KEOPS complex subunit Tprkb isoform X1 n=1 Tax=Rhodamnia argentea TaxID=178133 RepID=A0ABM3GX31_9MYRT|nr:EKC/KEOPS complex subunit Tprkb isoform X1 [Rhodamnia argentea]
MKAFGISNGDTLSVALFTDVTNSKELLDSMQAGTLEPEVALLNALLIPDIFPVLAAAHKTLLSNSRGSLTTRTLHSELVYNYSGSKHITESLKRCGISDSSTYVLAARFNASPDEVSCSIIWLSSRYLDLLLVKLGHHSNFGHDFIPSYYQMKAIAALTGGREIELEELEGKANLAQIQKHYKISGPELGISSLADAITCRIAARDAL